MDHSKLHKAGRGAAAKNASENRQRRRSLLQRKKRDDLARKQRDLEPLREKDNQSNAKQIQNDIRDRLSKWQQERAAKKKREKAAAKPVFKTGKISRPESALPIAKPQKDTKKKIAPEPPKPEKVVKTRSGRTARYVASRIDCQPPKSMANKKKDKKDGKSYVKSTKTTKENQEKITNLIECEPATTAEVKIVQSPPSVQKDIRETEPKVCQPQVTQSTDEDLPLDSLEMDAPPTSAGLSESFAPTNFQFKPPKGLHKFPFFPDSLLASTSTILPTIPDRGPAGFLSSTPYQPDSTTTSQQIQPPLPLALPCSSESSDDNEAKKEEKRKEVDNVEQGKEPEKEEDAEKSEKVLHFKSLVISETNKLTLKCKEWEEIKKKHEEELSEENLGKILSVIGQAQLVMAERFTQFGGLIEKCEHPTPDHNPVMPSDLEGFWDMIYFQVEDVLKKFKDLSDLKENNWEKAAEKKVVKRKRAAKRRSVKGSSALRRAAKKRIQAAKAAMKEKNLLLDEDDNVLKEETEADVEQNPKGGNKTVHMMKDEDAAMDPPLQEACRITRSGKRTPGRAQENTFSSDLATTATSADSQDETIVRRSKRKSARKNVSFVTPSKKRKTNFEDSSSGGRMTPSSGQPSKRVMRKTPLPSMRPDSVMTPGNMTPSNTDNMQCSPTLNRSDNSESPSPAVEHEPEYGAMKGLKLNFDDVESDEEKDTETGGIDEIYLSRTGINLLDEDSPRSPVFPGINAIVSSESPGLATIQSPQSPVIKTPLSSFSKSSTTVAQTTLAVPAKSPGRVLRNARKSFHHPMSPFMKKSVDSPLDSSTDLMSFSPVEIRKVSDNAHNEVGTVTKFAAVSVPKKIKERLGTDLVFSPVRRSARIASHHSSDESVQELHDTLDDCAKSGLDFGYLPNKV